MKYNQAITEKQYVKAWMKLLTQVAQSPRQIDEYFFGNKEERDESSDDIRPYFYTAIGAGVAVLLLCCAVAAQ